MGRSGTSSVGMSQGGSRSCTKGVPGRSIQRVITSQMNECSTIKTHKKQRRCGARCSITHLIPFLLPSTTKNKQHEVNIDNWEMEALVYSL